MHIELQTRFDSVFSGDHMQELTQTLPVYHFHVYDSTRNLILMTFWATSSNASYSLFDIFWDS